MIEVHADVSDRGRMAEIIARMGRDLPPLAGVVHAAGVLDDAVLVQQDKVSFARVMRPKIDGAWHLHQLTADADLDLFVLFSSVAALLGAPGQSNHGAANAFLDALAADRRARGLVALSIAWGAWEDVGAAARRGAGTALELAGIGTIPPPIGLEIFAAATDPAARVGPPRLGVLPVDWPRFASRFPAGAEPPAVAELIARERQARAGSSAGPGRRAPSNPAAASWRRQLAATTGDARRALLARWIADLASTVLRVPAGELDLDRPLAELGMDSLMAVEMRNRVRTDLGIELPLASLLEGATLGRLLHQIEAANAADARGAPAADSEAMGTEELATPADGNLDGDRAARLLIDLDRMSDEQVTALLDATEDEGGG